MSDSLARRALARAAARLNAQSRFAGMLPPLALMTDDVRLADPVAAARLLPAGSMVIVRSRDDDRRGALSRAMMSLAKTRGLVVLVASDGALALRSGADGVHLPEAQASQAAHWRVRCPRLLVTVAAHSLRAVGLTRHADAVVLAPIFPTSSHAGAPSLAPLRANMIAQLSPLPVYALGGIDARNARRIAGPNFVGLAAVSGLSR
jgi:thiamine-phosphate pyrophosphorylase